MPERNRITNGWLRSIAWTRRFKVAHRISAAAADENRISIKTARKNYISAKMTKREEDNR